MAKLTPPLPTPIGAGILASATASKFTFDELELPPRRAFGKEGNGATDIVNEQLSLVPVGKSFLIAVTVPDTVKAEERDAVFKENQRKTNNSVSGTIRRFKKAHAGYDFTARSVNDDNYGHGVRVWRIEPEAAPETPAADATPEGTTV